MIYICYRCKMDFDNVLVNLVLFGALDTRYERKVLESLDSIATSFVSRWKEYCKKRKVSFSAYLLHRRIHGICIPIWSDDTLRNILQELTKRYRSYLIGWDIDRIVASADHDILVQGITSLSLRMEKKDPLFLLSRNILIEENKHLLSPSENMFPYGSSLEESIRITKELITEYEESK